jgi:hypothetical protein
MASKVMHTGRDGGWRRSSAGFVAPSCPLTVIVCDRILYAPTIKHWMSFRGKWFYYGWLFSFQLLVHGLLEVNTFHVIQCNWWWMKSWIEGNFFGHFLVFSGLIMVFLQVYQLRSKRVYSLRRGVKKECDVSLCSIWSSGLMMVLVMKICDFASLPRISASVMKNSVKSPGVHHCFITTFSETRPVALY